MENKGVKALEEQERVVFSVYSEPHTRAQVREGPAPYKRAFHESGVQDNERVPRLLREMVLLIFIRIENILLSGDNHFRKDFRRELDVKRKEMNRIIKFELGYIPKGSKGSIQNKLRFYYNAYRRRDLGRGKQREESLKDAINRLKEEYPDFNPMFEKGFFQMQKKSFFQKLMSPLRR